MISKCKGGGVSVITPDPQSTLYFEFKLTVTAKFISLLRWQKDWFQKKKLNPEMNAYKKFSPQNPIYKFDRKGYPCF